MTNRPTSEKAFEDAIEAHLVEYAGYTKAASRQFDPELALDKHTLLAFLKETQPDSLDALKASYGNNLEAVELKLCCMLFWRNRFFWYRRFVLCQGIPVT